MSLITDGLAPLQGQWDAAQLKRKLRIVLVQEHTVLRDGLAILLERNSEFFVVGSFARSAEALADMPQLQPDVLITDWDANGRVAGELLAEARRLAPDCRALVLSAWESEDCARAALRAGADGFIVMLADLTDLITAVRTVGAGRQFICNSIATRILSEHLSVNRPVAAQSLPQSITGREREVLTRIALGNSNKAIARELGVSPKTVEKHRSNLMRKLQLHNAAAITMYAIRNGMTGSEVGGSLPMSTQRIGAA